MQGSASRRLLGAGLVAMLLAPAASAAPAPGNRPIRAYLVPPRTAPAADETFRVPVYVTDGSEDVVSYALQVRYDPAVLEVAAIEGGTFRGFSERPITDPATFRRGRTRFAAVNRGVARTHRTINIATIVFHVVGPSNTQTQIRLQRGNSVPIVVKRGFEGRRLRQRPPIVVSIR